VLGGGGGLALGGGGGLAVGILVISSSNITCAISFASS